MEQFRKELEQLINKHSLENGSDTPDFILADYLTMCLMVFDTTIQSREKWYGRTVAGKEIESNPYPNWNNADYQKWRENIDNAGVKREYRVEEAPVPEPPKSVIFAMFIESNLTDVLDKPVTSFGKVIGKVIDYDDVTGEVVVEIFEKFLYKEILNGKVLTENNLHGLRIG
jgi:hypothetical protein